MRSSALRAQESSRNLETRSMEISDSVTR